VLAVEQNFSNNVPQFMPLLLEYLKSPYTSNFDWTVRKMSIDVIYTFAAILKESIIPYQAEILEALSETRTDRIKPVREASLEAIQAVRDVASIPQMQK
jgi:nitrate reductase assembly molybdenum cofactor insertion protein NarJ